MIGPRGEQLNLAASHGGIDGYLVQSRTGDVPFSGGGWQRRSSSLPSALSAGQHCEHRENAVR